MFARGGISGLVGGLLIDPKKEGPTVAEIVLEFRTIPHINLMAYRCIDMNNPQYDLEDRVKTPDGIRLIVGRCWENWLWKGDNPTENWIYHCQPLSFDEKKKEWKRTGHVQRYPERSISKEKA